MTYDKVLLYNKLKIKNEVGGSGVISYNEYDNENSYHRPFLTARSVIPLVPESDELISEFENVTPRKGEELRSMELPISWDKFSIQSNDRTPKFIEIRTKTNYIPTPGDGWVDYYSIFGWIERAEPVSVKGPNSNTRIYWHPDYWITSQAMNLLHSNQDMRQYVPDRRIRLGAGRVKRAIQSFARPDPSTPRLWKYDSKTKIVRKVNNINDQDGPYTIILFTESGPAVGDENYTRLKIAFWGLNQTQITPNASKIPIQRIYDGLTEEIMGIAPSSIVGVWFAPVPPCVYSAASVHTHSYNQQQYGWYEFYAGTVPPETFHYPFTANIKTGDLEKYIVVDPLGTVQGTLPWGLEADRMVLSVDIGSAGAWLNIEFKNGSVTEEYGEGRKMQLPLISAPVTSNARSDYVLSGQEDYDRTMARLQQERNMQSGIANIGSSITGGAVTGAVAGGGIGAIAGAALGPALSGISIAANYWITEEYDSKSRRAMDALLSNQISNVIIGGGGSNWFWNNLGNWLLVKMKRDTVSYSELEDEQKELGYVTDFYKKNCQSLLSFGGVIGGGPLRIEGLETYGNVPPDALTAVSALFSRGVYLDEIVRYTW